MSSYDQLLQAWGDAFHPAHNPAGYKIMAVAENKLVWPMLKARLAQQQPLDAATGYTSSAGCDAIRSACVCYKERDRRDMCVTLKTTRGKSQTEPR